VRRATTGPCVPDRRRAVAHLSIASRSASACLPACRPAAVGALSAVAHIRTIGTGTQSLPVSPVSTWPLIGVAKSLLQVRIVVARPLPMPRVMLPVLDASAAIDADSSAAS